MSKRPVLKFYYDIASLHSWILFEQLCAAERCFGLNFQFNPIRMNSVYNATGCKNPYYVLAIRKKLFEDVDYFKKLYGVPFIIPTSSELKLSYIGTDTTQRFLTYVGLNYPESLRSVSRFLWRRLWVRDEEIYRHTDFSDVIREADLPSQIEDFSDSKTETILQKAEKEAIDYGCYDVPFTVIEREDKKPAIFIGMDSWPLISCHLDLPADRRGFYSLRSFNHLFDRTDTSPLT